MKNLISYIVTCNIDESLIDRLKSNIVTTLIYYFNLTGMRQNEQNKKLSCCRETARRLASLIFCQVTQGHSRSFEITLLSRTCISILLKLCVYPVPFLTYSASKNGVTLKLKVGVVQGHWKWRHSIDHIHFISPPLYI